MMRNYLTAALRNLGRNRGYAAINIAGLAVGLTAALLIGLFVRDELSYDRFIPGYRDVYRISAASQTPGLGSSATATDDVFGRMALLLREQLPQFHVARLSTHLGNNSLRHGSIEANEDGLHWADPNFFEVLPLRAIAGDLRTALDHPDGIVLTRHLARKYFDRDDVVGEVIEVNRKTPMRVTAVLEDLPANSHLNVDAVASGKSDTGSDGQFGRAYLYLRMPSAAAAERLRQELPSFMDRNFPPRNGVRLSDALHLPVVALADIHLFPSGAFAMRPAGNPATIRTVSVVGLLIVLIGAINFVNLMTARGARRAVEIGVRKAIGAQRRYLIIQFLGESLLYCLIAMVIAVSLTELSLPALNGYLDRDVRLDFLAAPQLLAEVFGLAVLVGILAGAYPALVLSSLRPVTVLTHNTLVAGGSARLRHVLVIVQFSILIALVLATILLWRQTRFSLEQGLRLDEDQVLVVEDAGGMKAFIAEVRRLPGVVGAANSTDFLHDYGTADYRAPDGRTVTLQKTAVGAGLLELLGLAPRAGRFFSEDRVGDAVAGLDPGTHPDAPKVSYRAVVNETAARQLGFKSAAEAIGKIFVQTASGRQEEIIGVAPDFSRDSISEPSPPVFYEYFTWRTYEVYIKLRATHVPETLAAIDRLWNQDAGTSGPIKRYFLSDYTQNLYANIARESRVLAAFAIVAVFLAGLGLLGLASYLADRRIKEIGVRKALGAGAGDLRSLLVWQFVKPVLWAIAIACPIAGVLLNRWLQGFAYHIDLAAWHFGAAAMLALAVAVLTVGVQCHRVARTKTVTALRYE